jgi:hypothetical protein
MKKSMVAATAAMVIATGALAGGLEGVECCGGKGLSFVEMKSPEAATKTVNYNKPELSFGIGAATMDGENVAGLVEFNFTPGSGLKLRDELELDSSYKAFTTKAAFTSGTNEYFAGIGYLKAEDMGRKHEGAFGVVGIGGTIPLGLVNNEIQVGYRIGEGKGVVAAMNFKSVIPGAGVSIRYDNADGFDRAAAYATWSF